MKREEAMKIENKIKNEEFATFLTRVTKLKIEKNRAFFETLLL